MDDIANRYDVILADPPWHFETWGEGDRNVTKYYPIMETNDICGLSVPASDNSVLFLWACWPKLKDAMLVIDAWGFEYKTIAWIWVKLNSNSMGFFTGMGYYTRANSEPCLLATKGKPPRVSDKGIQSLICSPVREHSRKPDEQYAKIEKLYPNKKYLELFARRQRPGWDVFGNEVENSIELEKTWTDNSPQ
jgi:N6-adenosine-specific RNA methylase IME4